MFKILILIIILLIIPHYIIEKKLISLDKFSIKNNNFTVFDLPEYEIQQQLINNNIIPSIKEKVLNLLPPNYTFLDYSYEIKNSSLYTFHRDVTSSKKFQHLKHDSYTLIIYFNKGNHLSICPGSDKSTILIPEPKTIYGDIGQSILFNCDLVHAAAITQTTKRYCKQYKICHYNDIDRLKHLQNQHIKKKENIRKLTIVDKYIRMMSHKYLPIFDIKSIGKYIERKQKSPIASYISKYLKLNFYNKT